MRFLTSILCLCLGTLAYAETQTPFALADVPVERPAPPIGGKQPAPIDLKQFRGKALVVVMFSTTCKHCQIALQDLMDLQQQYSAQGLQVVAIAGDEKADAVVGPFAEHLHLNFPFGFLRKAAFLTLAHLPSDGRPFVPIVLFVDPKGMVRNRLFGNDPEMKNTNLALSDGVKNLLAQSASLMRK